MSQTILVVDDTPENLRVITPTLEREGYKVLVALNGPTALERAKIAKPNLILLDIRMEGMDGFETCAKLKENPETREIPVIFMTALVGTDEKINGFKVGAVDYVTKPYQIDEVLARIETHLTINRLQKELKEVNDSLEEKVKERTKELEKAKEKAEESDRLKGEFLAQISHEVRTPVNGIISAVSFLDEECRKDASDQVKEDLNLIKRASDRLIRTIDLIVNVSQLRTGSLRFKTETFDIEKLITFELFDSYKIKAEEKGLILRMNKSTDNTEIEYDSFWATEMLNQLLRNSIDFTNSGEIEITLNRNNSNQLVVGVKDTGIGISSEYMPEIFEPFTQEHHGLKRTFEGCGLGLTFVKLLCDKTNVKLDVESIKNSGSYFTLTFS